MRMNPDNPNNRQIVKSVRFSPRVTTPAPDRRAGQSDRRRVVGPAVFRDFRTTTAKT